MLYAQLSVDQKVAFYNDLCEDPYTGNQAEIQQATTSLLKASGWSLDEINDNFKQFLDEAGLNDGTPSKCTIDLGLEPPPPAQPAQATPTPTPPKRSRKKASAAAAVSVAEPGPVTNGTPANPVDPATGQTLPHAAPDQPKRKGNPNLIPREPRVKGEQMLYPGLGKVSGIRLQFRNLAGEGCTLDTLVARYEVSGVSTSAKNKENAATFVRGYVNNGLKPEVDLFRLEPVSAEERKAAEAAVPAVQPPAPQPQGDQVINA